MKKNLCCILYPLLFVTFLSTQTALAHEFITKPSQMHASIGQTLPVKILSAHVFMKSEELEPLQNVTLYSVTSENRNDIPLRINTKDLTLQGSVDIKSPGTHIICGHREGVIWSKTTRGWKQESKKNLSGVISSGMYEKFSKAIVTTDQNDGMFKKKIGHKLEIIPLEDPSSAPIGSEIVFQVLYEGTPLTTEVYATYDGFSKHPNTYAYYSSSDESGKVAVKITHSGTWMVRIQHTINAPTEDFDIQVIRAVLVFGVNGKS